MTALGKLFRTTAFKLAVVYSIVFAAAASIVVFNVGRQVRIVLEDQIAETIDADIRGLADQYSQGDQGFAAVELASGANAECSGSGHQLAPQTARRLKVNSPGLATTGATL